MQRYEIATLTTSLGASAKAAPAIEAFSTAVGAKGALVGCWTTELGRFNQIIVLRGFDTADDLAAERMRTLLSANPFGCAEWLDGLTLESYAPFPFLPPVIAGDYGPIYEFRSYVLKTGGLAPTMAAWQMGLPLRTGLSPLLTAMYALDGAPRFTHIWPYKTLEERASVRADAVARGVWPAQGALAWLSADLRSTICLPSPVSPLQ